MMEVVGMEEAGMFALSVNSQNSLDIINKICYTKGMTLSKQSTKENN